MEDAKSPLSPTKVWSPHSAALHRRRKVGENSKGKILDSLGGLDLDDNDDDYLKFSNSDGAIKYDNTKRSPGSGRSPGRRTAKPKLTASLRQSVSKKEEADKELKESLAKVSPEIRAKLAKVFNKKTPMKERLQIEVDMMKNTDERKILADFKWKVDRKQFNINILESIESQQELLDRNLAEEAKRAKVEQSELQKKRQEKIEEEISKKERELEIERQVKIHKAKNIAMGAEELRKEAEKTAEAALRNKKKKEKQARDREAKIQAFLNGPGKHMTDVERELKVARMINNGEF